MPHHPRGPFGISDILQAFLDRLSERGGGGVGRDADAAGWTAFAFIVLVLMAVGLMKKGWDSWRPEYWIVVAQGLAIALAVVAAVAVLYAALRAFFQTRPGMVLAEFADKVTVVIIWVFKWTLIVGTGTAAAVVMVVWITRPSAMERLSTACRTLDYKNQGAFCDCLTAVLQGQAVADREMASLADGFSGEALQAFLTRNAELQRPVQACYAV